MILRIIRIGAWGKFNKLICKLGIKEIHMCSDIDKFKEDREKLNEIVMKYAGQPLKRFYSLDNQVYGDGALNKKTKELLGLIASFVLRCDDCIKYHVVRCHEEGVTSEELEEALSIGVVVGGSVTVPNLRRALKVWDELKQQ